jgi:hypothetical protein
MLVISQYGHHTIYRDSEVVHEFEGWPEEAHEWIVKDFCKRHGLPLPKNIESFKSPYFHGYQAVGSSKDSTEVRFTIE